MSLILPFVPLSGIEVSLAVTEEDKNQAYRLIHNSYVAAGYIGPRPDGLKKPQNAGSSSTHTLVAKIKGNVVGTITLMNQYEGQFPMESEFDLKEYSQDRTRTSEVGGLAVDPLFRKMKGAVLFPLFRAIVDFSREELDIDNLIITYNPRLAELYECLLLFRRIPGTKKVALSSVDGAPALAAHLNLVTAPKEYQKAYGNRKTKHNLYRYLFVRNAPCIKLPSAQPFTISWSAPKEQKI